jgi:hypothetical protein
VTALAELLDHSPLDISRYGLAELLSKSHAFSDQRVASEEIFDPSANGRNSSLAAFPRQ